MSRVQSLDNALIGHHHHRVLINMQVKDRVSHRLEKYLNIQEVLKSP